MAASSVRLSLVTLPVRSYVWLNERAPESDSEVGRLAASKP